MKLMKSRFVTSSVMLLAAGMLALSATAFAQDTEMLPPLPEGFGTLRVGTVPVLGQAPLFIAIERGYFEELGLDVEIQIFRSVEQMFAPLGLGEIDVIGGAPIGTALLNADTLDIPFEIVSGVVGAPEGHGTQPLLVRTELFDSGEITSAADLVGRNIAINAEGGLSEYLLWNLLNDFGLTLGDVTLTVLPYPDMIPAMANDAIDAAMLVYPQAGAVIAAGDAVTLVGGDQYVDNLQTNLQIHGGRMLLEENHEVRVRFLTAYLRGMRDMRDDAEQSFRNDEEILEILHTYTEVPVDVIRNSISGFFHPNGVINVDSVNDQIAYQINAGNTESSEMRTLSDFYNSLFLDEALARLGMVELAEATPEAGA
jgi:NitT/TauT family transport system substrate-binding protein